MNPDRSEEYTADPSHSIKTQVTFVVTDCRRLVGKNYKHVYANSDGARVFKTKFTTFVRQATPSQRFDELTCLGTFRN